MQAPGTSRSWPLTMLLTDWEITAEVDSGRVVIDPWDRRLVQPASLDLRLGDRIRVFRRLDHACIDPLGDPVPTETREIPEAGLVLHPGEFVLGSTLERVELPADIAASAEGKSSLGRIGLMLHSTAGWIDPGFRGTVTLELANVNTLPIRLRAGMLIGQLCLFRLRSPGARVPYGSPGLRSRYQGQYGPTAARRPVPR
jgi:dCTP deaminase